jgi:polysaccharide pyruvyl transferase WcaK-like protein
MEAILHYLRSEHPDAVVDAMCTGPERVAGEYGVDAIPLFWHHKFNPTSSLRGTALKALGKVVDAVRTASWTRRHDVVIVPGSGILEASLPLLPRALPYSMFVLSASGRLFSTKVAFVSVGAGAVHQRTTRWLFDSAARLAYYRSYRDPGALEAMRARGIDTSRDSVYPDLAFALPVPDYDPGHADLVGVGVMAYFGTNDERNQSNEIHASYVAAMKSLVRWLVDDGRTVRLLVGDTNGSDDSVVQDILADLRTNRPEVPASRVTTEPVSTFADVMRVMQPLGSVIAIRYHNILCALKLSKPTISISYSPKHDVLMADMGLPTFCQDVNSIDHDRLIELFKDLQDRSAELGQTVKERNRAKGALLRGQFAELSATLFPSRKSQGAEPSRSAVTAAH